MLIWCPAPLPEGPANALLTRMLIPTPYQVAAFGKTEILLPKGKSAEGTLQGKKRAASEDLEAETPKPRKKVSPRGSAATGILTVSCPPTGQPSTEL